MLLKSLCRNSDIHINILKTAIYFQEFHSMDAEWWNDNEINFGVI